MITECHSIVFHKIQYAYHRVFAFLFVVNIVGKNCSLECVAVVDKYHISGIFFAHRFNVRIHAGNTVVRCLFVVFVTVTPDIAVNVRGSDYRNRFGRFFGTFCK